MRSHINEITKEEFVKWIKSATKVIRRYTLSHDFSGAGEYVTLIEKDGTLYELHDWTERRDGKDQARYSISALNKVEGQEGDGI